MPASSNVQTRPTELAERVVVCMVIAACAVQHHLASTVGRKPHEAVLLGLGPPLGVPCRLLQLLQLLVADEDELLLGMSLPLGMDSYFVVAAHRRPLHPTVVRCCGSTIRNRHCWSSWSFERRFGSRRAAFVYVRESTIILAA